MATPAPVATRLRAASTDWVRIATRGRTPARRQTCSAASAISSTFRSTSGSPASSQTEIRSVSASGVAGRQPNPVARCLHAFDFQGGDVLLRAGHDDGDVELAVDQEMLEIAAAILDDVNGDGGKGASEPGENLGKHVAGDKRRHPERQTAGNRRLLAAQSPPRLCDIGKDLPGVTKELVALERQFDALGLALEQWEAEIALQFADRLRDRRLRDRKLVRRARDRAVFGSGDKILDLSKRKRHRGGG